MQIKFTIPGPPVAWKAARSVRTDKGIRHYSPTPVHEWKARVAFIAAQAMMGNRLLEGPLILSLTFYLERPPSRPKKHLYPDKKPDNKNLLAATEDALHGIVFHQDAQVCDTHIYKRYAAVTEGPRTEIIVEDMG